MEHDRPIILTEAHERIVGGHYARKSTTQKKLHAGLWCPTVSKDEKEYLHTHNFY